MFTFFLVFHTFSFNSLLSRKIIYICEEKFAWNFKKKSVSNQCFSKKLWKSWKYPVSKKCQKKNPKKKEKWKYSIEIEKENNPQKIAILVYRFWIFCEQNNKDLWTKNKKLYINNWNVGIWSILPSSRNPTRNVLSGEFEVRFPGSQNRIHVLGRGFCLEFLKVPYGMRDVKKVFQRAKSE